MPRSLALHIVAEVAGALDYAHHAVDAAGTPLNLVHRDVTPHNVLLSVHGDVKLADFGIAKSALGGSRTLTGVVHGKPRYMAPEQQPGRLVDARADIYSLGVMLWELSLWCAAPDRPEAPRPRQVDPGYPAQLEQVVGAALQPDRRERRLTARQLRSRLLAHLGAAASEGRAELGGLVRRLFPDLAAGRGTPGGSVAGPGGVIVGVDAAAPWHRAGCARG